MRTQVLRVNHANFMTKLLKKVIMKRSKLRNDFLKDRNDASQSALQKITQLMRNPFAKSQKTAFLEFRIKTCNQ